MSDSTQTTLLYVLVAACIAVCFLVPDIGFAVLALFYLLITPLVLLFDPAYFQPQLAAAFVFAALGIFLTMRTVRRKFDLPFFFSGMFYGVVLIIISAAVICVNCPKYWIPTVVICAAYLYYLYTRHKAFLQTPEAPAPASPKPAAPVPADPPASAAPPAPAASADPVIHIPTSLRGAPLAYHYDDVFMDSPDIPAVLQSFDIPLSFRPEADAIAIYANDRRLGVLAHSRLVDMIRDWIDRDDPFLGFLTSCSEDTGRVTFGLYFYRFSSRVYDDEDSDDDDTDDPDDDQDNDEDNDPDDDF